MRQIAMSPEQARTLEEVGKEMLGKGDYRATALLSLHLAYRYAPFACEIDESAGMAEVVDLHSKKA